MKNLVFGGSDAPPSRWLVAVWCTGAGWLMGAVYLGVFEWQGTGSSARLLALASVTAGLCAAAAAVGALPSRPLASFGATLTMSFVVSLVCSPLTFLLVNALDWLDPARRSSASLEYFVAATVMGAVFAAPLGLGFGLVAGTVAAMRAWLAARRSLSSRDLTLMLLGGGWLAIGAGTLVAFDGLPQARPGITGLSWALATVGGLAAVVGGARPSLRLVYALGIRADLLNGWSFEPPAGDGALPSLFPVGPQASLVRTASHAEGPFRSGGAAEPVATLGPAPTA